MIIGHAERRQVADDWHSLRYQVQGLEPTLLPSRARDVRRPCSTGSCESQLPDFFTELFTQSF